MATSACSTAACRGAPGIEPCKRMADGYWKTMRPGNEEVEMTGMKFIAVGVLAAAVAVAWVQKDSIRKLRQHNAELRQGSEGGTLAAGTRGADDQEIEKL